MSKEWKHVLRYRGEGPNAATGQTEKPTQVEFTNQPMPILLAFLISLLPMIVVLLIGYCVMLTLR